MFVFKVTLNSKESLSFHPHMTKNIALFFQCGYDDEKSLNKLWKHEIWFSELDWRCANLKLLPKILLVWLSDDLSFFCFLFSGYDWFSEYCSVFLGMVVFSGYRYGYRSRHVALVRLQDVNVRLFGAKM